LINNKINKSKTNDSWDGYEANYNFNLFFNQYLCIEEVEYDDLIYFVFDIKNNIYYNYEFDAYISAISKDGFIICKDFLFEAHKLNIDGTVSKMDMYDNENYKILGEFDRIDIIGEKIILW